MSIERSTFVNLNVQTNKKKIKCQKCVENDKRLSIFSYNLDKFGAIVVGKFSIFNEEFDHLFFIFWKNNFPEKNFRGDLVVALAWQLQETWSYCIRKTYSNKILIIFSCYFDKRIFGKIGFAVTWWPFQICMLLLEQLQKIRSYVTGKFILTKSLINFSCYFGKKKISGKSHSRRFGSFFSFACICQEKFRNFEATLQPENSF